MNCPLFIDNTRECMEKIQSFPQNLTIGIIKFCTSKDHLNCPFYKILKTQKNICQHIKNCPAFKNFQSCEFKEFVELSNKYCTSENHTKCKRYIFNKKGKNVPKALHPNGTIVTKWQ